MMKTLMKTRLNLEILATQILSSYEDNIKKEVVQQQKDKIDVVTSIDLANEQSIYEMLKQLPSVAGMYGEENGYQAIFPSGNLIAVVDPIDGTRPFCLQIFYSSISVAFYAKNGKFVAGILILINNQNQDNKIFLLEDGLISIYTQNKPYFTPYVFPDYTETTLAQEVVSVCNVGAFEKQWPLHSSHQEDGWKISKLLRQNSRGEICLYSGAAEIMSVMKGKIGGYINLGKIDVVSHAVALEIAKLSPYIRVQHVYTEGDNFDLDIKSIMQNEPKFSKYDGSIVLYKKDLNLKKEITEIGIKPL
mgnify:CR=1 FL=1